MFGSLLRRSLGRHICQYNNIKNIQMRYGGGLAKNKFIEEWNSRRESTDETFEMTYKPTFFFLIAGVIIPTIIWIYGKKDKIARDKELNVTRKYL